jgi:hypothetical protein
MIDFLFYIFQLFLGKPLILINILILLVKINKNKNMSINNFIHNFGANRGTSNLVYSEDNAAK